MELFDEKELLGFGMENNLIEEDSKRKREETETETQLENGGKKKRKKRAPRAPKQDEKTWKG